MWGAGLEQNLSDMFYVKAEGRYSRYNNHTHTMTGLIGAGVLFGASHEEVAPPPPPPAAAASGDADLPGRQRDRRDGNLPAAAAAASAAASPAQSGERG